MYLGSHLLLVRSNPKRTTSICSLLLLYWKWKVPLATKSLVLRLRRGEEPIQYNKITVKCAASLINSIYFRGRDSEILS